MMLLVELVQNVVTTNSESPVCLLAPPTPRPALARNTDQAVSERRSFFLRTFASVSWLLFALGPRLGCRAGVDVALFLSFLFRFGFSFLMPEDKISSGLCVVGAPTESWGVPVVPGP